MAGCGSRCRCRARPAPLISSHSREQQQSSHTAENRVRLVTRLEEQLGPPSSPRFSTDAGRYAHSRAEGH